MPGVSVSREISRHQQLDKRTATSNIFIQTSASGLFRTQPYRHITSETQSQTTNWRFSDTLGATQTTLPSDKTTEDSPTTSQGTPRSIDVLTRTPTPVETKPLWIRRLEDAKLIHDPEYVERPPTNKYVCAQHVFC